ncbi:LAMI_0F15742g1_1 [Lachancea mirantina]|uniref:rRNA-processing protein EFG1 n=1 Tax=Lachancea mirantina TaxID=1230905 RepID=A0A1G4K4P3_9SACH|nr:LAMI_0F15742g1_1 [Lachancea mirantina]
MNKNHSMRSKRAGKPSSQLSATLGGGANKVKKKIREIQRLLQKKKDVLPDTVLIEKERTLEALQLELESAELRKKQQKNAKKYHMVRFFERKKALRKYKRASERVHASSPQDKDEVSAAKKQLWKAEVDLCYVVNFSRLEKYIALYPSEDADNVADKGDKTLSRRQQVWEAVEKHHREGTLPVALPAILKGHKLDDNQYGVSWDQSRESGRLGERGSVNDGQDENEDDFFE